MGPYFQSDWSCVHSALGSGFERARSMRIGRGLMSGEAARTPVLTSRVGRGSDRVADVVQQKTLAASKEYIKSGNILAGEGRYKAAAESYQKAISLDPKSAEAYSLMRSALAQAGSLREAVEALRKAVSLKPDYGEGYYHLGYLLKSQGKEREAEEAFSKAKQYQRR